VLHATDEKSKQFCDEIESEFDKNNYSRLNTINLSSQQYLLQSSRDVQTATRQLTENFSLLKDERFLKRCK
jgi:hypothetical protein